MLFRVSLGVILSPLSLAWALAATPALAQEPGQPAAPRPGVTITQGPAPRLFTSKQEEVDAAELDSAQQDIGSKGYPGLGKHIKALQTVLDHAPARYPRIDVRGAEVYIRTADQAQYLVLALLAGAAGGDNSANVTVFQAPNVYPLASQLLGSYANEMKQPEAAIKFLDRGLALQPDNGDLISERNAAYMLLKRFPDIVAASDVALADPLSLGQTVQARLLRNKAYALGEMNRIEEAEATYRESLKIEPRNAVALNELRYLAGLKRGRAPKDGELTSPANPIPLAPPAKQADPVS